MERIEFYKHDLGDEEIASVTQTLRSLFLTLGPRVGEFEKVFGEFIGQEHVVGVSSCTMGLALVVGALGIGPGDEVITTPMTFISTPNAALFHGAVPVFADVDPRTGLLDPAAVEAAITPRTRAVIAVHLYGQLSDMRTLRAICDRHHLALIEDAAHAIEAEQDGVRVAELGDATVFSFYATKTMTSGDGGAVSVRDGALAARLRRLRNHGVSKDAAARHGGTYVHWDMVEFGYKAAMTDVEAALLLPQVGRLLRRRDNRQAIVVRYESALASRSDLELMTWSGRSSHHLFPVLVPLGLRDRVLTGMGERGIGVAVNYRAVHTLRYYKETFGYAREAFPVAADIGDRTLSLPLYPQMTHAEVDRVVAALGETLSALR
ncbi:MAG TPA: DegT/DnrJ/EryC1/StrS family aminotransferase [Polyangiaceae bacterium]|nr:DegT/DnrJ/EryC1/StrS family aminotransferase [Polyangiaceae bacterium]